MANKLLRFFKLGNFVTNATLLKAFKNLFEISKTCRKLDVDNAVGRGHLKVSWN